MPIRKPAIVLQAYSGLYACNAAGSATSSTAASSTRARGGSTRAAERPSRSRCYATVAGDSHGDNDHSHSQDQQSQHSKQQAHVWPDPPKGHIHPTPYQIFGIKHNANYTKHRFYELVKLYHPDLTASEAKSSAQQVRAERYRLLVAANAILSDPIKRSAYDRVGAGWNGRAEVPGAHGAANGKPGPFTHGFNGSEDPIWQNATWEDWERFYARKAREQDGGTVGREPNGPLYMQNSYFIALVALLAFIGGSVNYNRAQDAGTYFVEQRDLVHDRASKELRKVRQEMSGMKGREERIQWFLRNREATLGQMSPTDIEAFREEKAQRILPNGEVCRADGTISNGKNEG
ncbi:hypothetical protein KC315_g2550 [Hortaea werneckii]|nr:hypothetical protein KC315_g2550 [Hortaea werneckii]